MSGKFKTLFRVTELACFVLLFVLAPAWAAGTVTWDGGGGDSDWFNSDNWDPAQVPANGDGVVIGGSASVVLSNSTAELSSFVITNATLTFTNWTTALKATNVTIQNAGKLTHKACDTNAAPSNTNRVYVVCSNLMIEAGGSINTDYLGYRAADGTELRGQGPGGGYCTGGGGYGGAGAAGYPYSPGSSGGSTYGLSNAPVQPGSGGGSQNASHLGKPGGGAVRIAAAGRVTINGTITANGQNNISASHGGAGSGGGIYITCNTFAGTNGVIRANGGDSHYINYYGGGGGGGRIAVIYDTAAQSALNLTDKPSVVFSAGQGIGYYAGSPGTIFLSDSGFYPSATVLYGGELIIPGFLSWTVESLTITDGLAVFPSGLQLIVNNNLTVSDTGAGIKTVNGKVTVGGNLTISAPYSGTETYRSKSYFVGGSDSETVVSGDVIIDDGYLSFSSVSTNTHVFHIGGDLIVTNTGGFYVTAGLTNASSPDYCALISVTGDVFIAYSSWIYPYSDKTNVNAGTPLFRMRNLTIVTNGGFNANSQGFDGGQDTATWGSGPGGGYYSGGGGYGGQGGLGWKAGSIRGPTYGSSNAPVQAGSGGGGYGSSSAWYGRRGGCSVRIEAARKLTVNGTITANGQGSSNYGGAGSGGGIYIRCRTFTGETTGILRANGGSSTYSQGGGGGGGGRIAVWRTYHTYEGTSTVTGGTAYSAAWDGEDGTIVWGHIPPKGAFIHIR